MFGLALQTAEWIAIGIVAAGLLLAFVAANLKICAPNELLIFSGKTRKLPDGSTVGYRVVKGGRGFRIPILESVRTMSLETIPLTLDLSGILAQGLIPLNVRAMANVKIAGDEDHGLSNAVERFLGRSREEIARTANQTLEGALRGVMATLSPEQANSERLALADRVREASADDLRRLGIVVDTFRIQSISDTQHYLEAIGRKRNAEVQRDARIAEAEADAEARRIAAEAGKRASIAEAEAEAATIEARNALRVKTAELDAVGGQAEARAEVAGQIARVEQEKLLEEQRIELNRSKYEAEVVIPAQARKEAEELRAKGEAARIIEDGKATAEAVRLMRQEWEQGETRELFVLQQLPDIIDRITRVIAENLSIEKLTVLEGGNGGLSNLVGGLTGSVVAVMEQIKNATGLDIADILRQRDRHRGELNQ